MNLGSLVVILGSFDTRVRQHDDSQLTVGTLEQVLVDGQVSVLLADGTIWVGEAKNIAPASEQE